TLTSQLSERVTNPIAILHTLDFRVCQALRKANSPPFHGLLEKTVSWDCDESRNSWRSHPFKLIHSNTAEHQRSPPCTADYY
ncbi:MAG: hypothetical protein ABF308_21840, partial [Phaeobacter gallaeciensis]